jgi:AcrR family transcriptional regulator
LDAAERRLRDAGLASLRLQEVAADVGVSHPAVLHHFGSREGLVQAVVERAIERLQEDLVSAMAEMKGAPPDGAALFDRVFEALSEHGHARLMASLLLSGYEPFRSEAVRRGWAKIAEATHALRLQRAKGRNKPSYQDTRFTIVLSALALFGQAIAGSATFAMAGFGDSPQVERNFRNWLAALLAGHLDA